MMSHAVSSNVHSAQIHCRYFEKSMCTHSYITSLHARVHTYVRVGDSTGCDLRQVRSTIHWRGFTVEDSCAHIPTLHVADVFSSQDTALIGLSWIALFVLPLLISGV